MNFLETLILGIYGFIVFVWVARHAAYTWIARGFAVLRADSPRYAGAEPPRVTAIIPAKDEEAVLGGCLETVVAQSYPNLEILVVNDRSGDGTESIAREAEARDDRVRLINIRDLPDGWTGKTHALHVATREAAGDWLWFVDADTRHHADALSIMLEHGRRNQAALVSLVPELRCETFWEKALQPLEGIVLMRSFSQREVNNDSSPVGFANGQNILVEREAYEAVGGHDAVRERFVEDIYMAKNVKASGRPIRLAIGTEISSTRMYTNLGQIVRGWSRILYDALDRRVGSLVGKIIEPLFFSQTGDVAFVVSIGMLLLGHRTAFAWWLFGLSVVHQVLKTTMLYRLYRVTAPRTAHYAVWYGVAGVVSAWISLDAIRSCLTGNVTWRGTRYRQTNAMKGQAERFAATEAVSSPREGA